MMKQTKSHTDRKETSMIDPLSQSRKTTRRRTRERPMPTPRGGR
jgi:hypothetical protein